MGNHIYLNFFGAEIGSEIGPECLGPLQYVPLLGTIIELTYYFVDGIILIPALVILLNLRIKDAFFLHRVLISMAVIIIFLGDVVFIDYAGNYSWLVLILGDMLYNFGYICFAFALIWYYKLSQLINKNIDLCIKESDDLVKSAPKFIDNDISQLKETDGIFENIDVPNKAYEYLRNLLKDAKKDCKSHLQTFT